jgi:transposase
MEKYYISDENWQKLYEILRFSPKIRVKKEEKTRKFVEGVHFILKTGAQWRELPAYYGKWRSVHKRYEAWCRKGVWLDVLGSFSSECDTEWFMIDATIVRAHPCAAGYQRDQHEREALGRSKGGFTTKIHAVVDALGQAVRFTLTPGHRNDITQAPALIEGIKDAHILADKGYDADAFIEQIQTQQCTPVIPPRSNRKNARRFDKYIYKERHLIECFFNKIKHFRRVFSRFDKKASSFAGFLAYASFILWMR